MSYQVIARKYRPDDFSRVIGQDHITKALMRAIELARVHHAYLFTGARGVGKTSTARILAKALNCQKGPTPSPCGQCQSCKEIALSVSLDVREIDGASNTGVEDVRQLREDVAYLPTREKYRIYIIDEVHMLSTSAFNALLKTLEEPPAHVVFIFATTEPHKILETILSRCQRYDFRLLTQSQILKQLKDVCEAEGIKADPEALQILAQEAAGSMRDAETMLDQIIPSVSDKMTADLVVQSLGLIDRKTVWNALRFIVERNPVELLRIARELHEYGHDIKHFVQDLLALLRHLNVAALQTKLASQELAELLELADSEVALLLELAPKISATEGLRLYRLLASHFVEISHAQNQRMALEMALLRLVQNPPVKEINELIEELRAIQLQAPKALAVASTGPKITAPAPPPAKTPVAEAREISAIPAVDATNPLWARVLEQLRSQKPLLSSALEDLLPLECMPQKIVLGVPKTSFAHDTVKDPRNQQLIAETAQKETGILPAIEIQILKELTSSKSEGQKRAEERKALSAELRDHPVVKEIRTIFGAEIQDVRTLNPKTSGKDNP